MPLQDITITASINSLATHSYGQKTYIASSEDQSFPIETITGSYAGAWPDFRLRGLTTSNSASNTTEDLIVNITQSWPESIITPLGLVTRTHNTMEEFINGEFSGSSYVISNGNLTDEDCRELLVASITPSRFTLSNPPIYNYYLNNVLQGQDELDDFYTTDPTTALAYIFLNQYEYPSIFPAGFYLWYITHISINKLDAVLSDQTSILERLEYITWIIPSIGTIRAKVLSINENANRFIYEVDTTVEDSLGVRRPYFTTSGGVLPSISVSSIILEPYFATEFSYSDCDILQNNAFQNDTSQYIQKVLYDDGSVIPSNFAQIISGTAEPAELNDYLYNASDSILPRYVGSRTTSADINQPYVVGFNSTILSTMGPVATYTTSSVNYSQNLILNPGLTGSGIPFPGVPPFPNNNDMPPNWRHNAGNQIWASVDYWSYDIVGFPGGIGFIGPSGNPSNTSTLRQAINISPFILSSPYRVEITIPPASLNPNTGTERFGPPLVHVTCSFFQNGGTGIENTRLGYIPPGQSGIFRFDFTASAFDVSFGITAPDAASDLGGTGAGVDYGFAIANISVFPITTITPPSPLSLLSISSSNNPPNVEQYSSWFAYFNYIEPTRYKLGPTLTYPAYYINLISLINTDGGKINLSSLNNIPVPGTNVQNPYTSNFNLLQTLLPDNSEASMLIYNGISFTGSISDSGSFTPFKIYKAGYNITNNSSSMPQYLSTNEGGLIIYKPTNLQLVTSENYPVEGLIIPKDFNPFYKKDILKIAQEAGYFNSI